MPLRPAHFLIATLTWSLLAQQIAGQPCQMNNSTVIELLRAGLTPNAVVDRIVACTPQYGLTPADTDALLKAGVSESLIKAMAARTNGEPIPASSRSADPARAVLPPQSHAPITVEPNRAGSVEVAPSPKAPVTADPTIAPSTQAGKQPTYTVKYSGGSLPFKSGEDLKLSLDGDGVKLATNKSTPTLIPAASVTEISYGQEVHRRIGTAVGLAVISLGIGAITAFSKSKKHYIGIIWDDAGKKGGAAFQADKNEFRGLLAALEGISGHKAVNTDAPSK